MLIEWKPKICVLLFLYVMKMIWVKADKKMKVCFILLSLKSSRFMEHGAERTVWSKYLHENLCKPSDVDEFKISSKFQ